MPEVEVAGGGDVGRGRGGVVGDGLWGGGGEPLREAGAWFGGGLGAEDGDVVGGAAERWPEAGECGGEAEVAAEFGDEVAGGAVVDVVDEFGGVDALEQFEAEGFGVGGRGGALDVVLDGADDLLACGGVFGVCGGGGLGDVFGEDDGASDGLGDAVEGGGAGGDGDGRVGDFEFEEDCGADVEDCCEGALVGVVVEGRGGGGGGHERKGNLSGVGVKGIWVRGEWAGQLRRDTRSLAARAGQGHSQRKTWGETGVGQRRRILSATVGLGIALTSSALAQTAGPLAPRDVPAKTIPVPDTVSPEMRAIVAQTLRTNWDTPPTTPEGWTELVKQLEAATATQVAPMAERMHVTIEPSTIDGVHTYTLTPETIPDANRNRLLLHVHGGCYVLNPHLAALPEAILVAGFGHMKVIAVDYRMPPEAYFPGALDDAMTVYKAAARMVPPRNLGVFGSSAGGALTLEMMLRAKAEGLPMPGAIAPGTPMSDVTKQGDSFATNALVDNVLVSPDGFCDAATRFYAKGHDLKDPLLSPVYGDLNGFPPTILTSGTRDLLLSNTVRVNQKLRQAGVETRLQVFEAQSHAQFYRDDRVPEVKEAISEIAGFFDQHLGH